MITVMCSLTMSIGICTAFGVVPTLMAVYVLPVRCTLPELLFPCASEMQEA